MKLFMFYVGGNCGASNIELHDVRFSVGQTPEACYADLRRQWWGDPHSLHLDSWGVVEQADGHDISIESGRAPAPGDRLFFVNLGGYDPCAFGELHRNLLIVAADAKAAKAKALSQVNGWFRPHKDRIFEVDKALDLSGAIGETGNILTLTPARVERPFAFTCDYVPIA